MSSRPNVHQTTPLSTYDPVSEIDALFGDIIQDGPGAAIGVYHQGRLVYSQGYGQANLESGQHITAQTQFHAASLSKQFTAFAISILAREGALSLDDEVHHYLPFVPNVGHRITLRHLLFHTSGLRDYLMLALLSGHGSESRISQQQVLNLVARQRTLNFTPGSEYGYSNTGYTLLAEIVRLVSGRTLREFTTEQIFTRLGMHRTFFFDDVTEIVPGRALSYSVQRDAGGQSRDTWSASALMLDNVGSTGLYTTVTDLARWAGHLTAPTIGIEGLMDQFRSAGALDDGTPISYGFGLEHSELAGRRMLSHSGADAAFRSIFAYLPDHDFAVAILANTELNLMNQVLAVTEMNLPSGPSVPESVVLPPDPDADLHQFVGTYRQDHGVSCRLTVQDDQLMYQVGSRAPQALVIRADGSVDFGEPAGIRMSPVRDTKRDIIGLDVPRPGFGRPLRLSRVTTPQTAVTDLNEYVGDYRSPELDTIYSINADDHQLVVHHLWSHRPKRLALVQPDRFEAEGDRFKRELRWVLHFQRDRDNTITGLVLHTAGERNIRFDRLNTAHPVLPTASTPAWGAWT
ncbi:serine hydrolase domain-containing protein [Micrococcaceae sp. AOP34-BR2-30]